MGAIGSNTRSHRSSSLAAFVVALLAIVGSAHAVPLFDSASFGTGVLLGVPPATERFRPPNPAAEQALNMAFPFRPLADETRFVTGAPGTLALGVEGARARADFVTLELGARASMHLVDGSFAVAQAMASAFVGFTVSGGTPSTLPGFFKVDGSFFLEGPSAARAGLQDLRVLLDVWDIEGNFLGELTAEHQRFAQVIPPTGPLLVDLDEFPGSFDVPGSLNVPFTISLGDDNGVIARLWVFARADEGDTSITDFLTTATLSFSPPPGVIVRLATGQVFGAAPQGIPEPATLLLLAFGMLGIPIIVRDRKKPHFRPPRSPRIGARP